MKLPKLRIPGGIDWSLYIVPLLLCIFGITIIFSISYGTQSTITVDQIEYVVLGFIVAILISLIDYRTLKGLYLVLYIIGVLLLIAVMFFGSRSFGATRWIDLGFFRLQPSEIFKLITVIVLARMFANWQEMTNAKIWAAIIMIVLPMLLILIQPDLGTASVVFITLCSILLISPIKKTYLLIALGILLVLSPIGYKTLKPYQKDRIAAFINPSHDPQGAGYNVSQAKIAVGSGGLLGQGIGKGSQGQLNFLPVAHTDFIFASTAEATGFIGSLVMIALLIFLLLRVINIARQAKDDFGMYLASGIGVIFLFQTFVNIGMNIGIMPVTGIPLPFVSYGGSAMLVNMAYLGILQSIYLRHRKISF